MKSSDDAKSTQQRFKKALRLNQEWTGPFYSWDGSSSSKEEAQGPQPDSRDWSKAAVVEAVSMETQACQDLRLWTFHTQDSVKFYFFML